MAIVAINIPIANVLGVNMPVADCEAVAIAASRFFLSYIKTSFHFSASTKNCNTRKVMLIAGLSIANRSKRDMPAISMLPTSMPITCVLVVYILIISMLVARTFLFYIFLAVFVFLIMKIIIQR